MQQELYINNQRVELQDNSLILFTYQKADHTNPTAVKNNFSKTVSIPGTSHNNAIFNSIFNLDYYSNTDTFNPAKRTPFTIYMNGDIVERGYVKLNKINKSCDYVSYDVTLYGGLGDFFYGLTYDDDGNKLDLGSLTYRYDDDTVCDIDFYINSQFVYNAWNSFVIGSTNHDITNIINFAPCYNGLPKGDGFDAGKVFVDTNSSIPGGNTLGILFDGEEVSSWPTRLPVDTTQAATSNAISSSGSNKWAVVTLGDKATEWEMRDLRSYLQRPVVRLKKVFKGIQDYAKTLGYTLIYDDSFFNSDNPYYEDAWLTLKMFNENKTDIKTGDHVVQHVSTDDEVSIFGNTETPFDYLVSFAKMFDLYFSFDKATKTINLLTRANFYITDAIDISDAIDRTSVEVVPLNYNFKWLEFGYKEGEGDRLDAYTKYYGAQYGGWRIKTEYDFDSSTKKVPDNIIYKNAVDVLEQSQYFRNTNLSKIYSGGSSSSRATVYHCTYPPFMNGDDLNYGLFSRDSSSSDFDTENIEIAKQFSHRMGTPRTGWSYNVYSNNYWLYNYKNDIYNDFFPKPQFHDESGEATDGANVLLFFNGVCSPRADASSRTGQTNVPYSLTDDVIPFSASYNGMEDVLDGKHCYVFPKLIAYDSDNINIGGYDTQSYDKNRQYTIYKVPMFNRCKLDYDTKLVDRSFDFTSPRMLYFPQFRIEENNTISTYAKWLNYISDLYNQNTRVVTCEVELPIGINDALHRIYWFDNCYWMLNKVNDYDYENHITKCEFTKVNNPANYAPFISMAPQNLSIDAEGGNNDFIITLNGVDEVVVPTLTVSDDWFSATSTKISDNNYKITTTVNLNLTGKERDGSIKINWGGAERTYTIHQLDIS